VKEDLEVEKGSAISGKWGPTGSPRPEKSSIPSPELRAARKKEGNVHRFQAEKKRWGGGGRKGDLIVLQEKRKQGLRCHLSQRKMRDVHKGRKPKFFRVSKKKP